jgi:hypothetical protein
MCEPTRGKDPGGCGLCCWQLGQVSVVTVSSAKVRT